MNRLIVFFFFFGKFTKLFGISDSSDIQRFCYYSGTKCVCTFVGFTDKSKMNDAIALSSVKTNIINLAVFDYPYKTEASELQSSQQTNQRASEMIEKSKFSYIDVPESESDQSANRIS